MQEGIGDIHVKPSPKVTEQLHAGRGGSLAPNAMGKINDQHRIGRKGN